VGRRHVLVLHGELRQMQSKNCAAESEGCERVIQIWKMLLKFSEIVFCGWSVAMYAESADVETWLRQGERPCIYLYRDYNRAPTEVENIYA
jgi:hypothetical protein